MTHMKKIILCNTAPVSHRHTSRQALDKLFFYKTKNCKKKTNTTSLFDCFIADNENLIGERIHDRAHLNELCNVFDISEIVVKITNGGICHSGWLHDVSSGGAAIRVSPFSASSVDFYLTFFLGTRLISTHATVKHVHAIGGMHIIGFVFVDIADNCKEYLQGSVYITKLLHEKNMI